MGKTLTKIRTVDDLGRVVLPVKIRRALDIDAGDAVEVSVYGGRIVIAPVVDDNYDLRISVDTLMSVPLSAEDKRRMDDILMEVRQMLGM